MRKSWKDLNVGDIIYILPNYTLNGGIPHFGDMIKSTLLDVSDNYGDGKNKFTYHIYYFNGKSILCNVEFDIRSKNIKDCTHLSISHDGRFTWFCSCEEVYHDIISEVRDSKINSVLSDK